MLKITRDLNLTPDDGRHRTSVQVNQYATDVEVDFILFTSDGEFTPADGMTAEIRGVKYDGNAYSKAVGVTVEGGVATVTVPLDEQMTCVAGTGVYEIVLRADGNELSTKNFELYVARAAMDKDTLPSESVVRELVDVVDRTDELVAAAAAIEGTGDAVLTAAAEAAASAVAAGEARDAAVSAGAEVATVAAGFQDAVAAATEALDVAKATGLSELREASASYNAAAALASQNLATQESDAIVHVQNLYTELSNDLEERKAHVDAKAAQIMAVTTSAEDLAGQAVALAQSTQAATDDMRVELQAVRTTQREQDEKMLTFADDMEIDNEGQGWFLNNGERIAGPFTGMGGGGGGGGSATVGAEFSCTNRTGWISTTIADGDDCFISIEWSSIEDGMSTGAGRLRVADSTGKVYANLSVEQGLLRVNLAPYLKVGANTLRVTVYDTYDQHRTFSFTVNDVAISLSASLDVSEAFRGPILFSYTPVGTVSKTVHFEMDGEEIGTATTSVSGRALTFLIPQQTHGAHTFRCWFECDINSAQVRSNVLRYELICLEQMNDSTIITSSFEQEEADCYTTLNIGYIVYDPSGMTTSIAVFEDDEEVYTGTVDRSPRVYAYRAEEPGEHAVRVEAGNASRTFAFTVRESDIHVEAATDQLKLFLTSAGRTNDDDRRAEWVYDDGEGGTVEAELTGFGFTSDGWRLDAHGIPALHVAGDARVTIPFKPFATDKRANGFTFEVDFATNAVMDYDATILSCMSGGRGLEMTANSFTLRSEQSELGVQFKEDEHIHAVFVVESRNDNRFIFSYIDGVLSRVVQYPRDDDFSQLEPVDITIGSNDCAVDLYTIRVYDTALSRAQVLENWLAATQDGELMRERYRHNDVLDDYGNVSIGKLPSDLPYMVVECPELPQKKGDKKTVTVTYVDPETPARSFTAANVQADVQGTSSQVYYRKNYKLKFKSGFTMTINGGHADTFPLRPGAIGGTIFTMKADVASSEGANNVELVRLYNDCCPYKTPAQLEDPRVRQAIDGIPIVMFWRNTANDETTFLGKYNFNNDKGDFPIFGFAPDDESWEIANNGGLRVIWKSDDFESTTTDTDGKTIPAWTQDFESRFPEDYFDASQLKEFATWLKSTDQEQATGAALEPPVQYGGVTYANDTATYRLAKFKAELEDYVELDSAIFYYIFTELFLMVDSRAKNAFPSFMGSAVSE